MEAVCQIAQKTQSLSLVLPAYQEELGIRQVLEEAIEALSSIVDEFEILVVDDGSSDSTAAIVQDLAELDPRVRLLQHGCNRGYGAALRTGFDSAQHEFVAFSDADGQLDLRDLRRLLDRTDSHDVVVGYRVQRQDPWQRRFYSWGYNTLVRTLLGTGVRDCDCALKVFRRETLQRILPETNRFFVNTEMLTKARQQLIVVAEVGVRHRPRLRGSSKVSLWDIPRTLSVLIPFWWSSVLFAQARPAPQPTQRPWLFQPAFWCLMLMAALLSFGQMGVPLQEPEEPRYAEIPRQMLAEGQWLVPTLHGQPYLDKPPLLYWLVMTSYQVFGVEDYAARLPACLAVFFTIVATYFWAHRVIGPGPALAAAGILTLSGRFLYLGKLLTMNSLLALWVTIALAAGHLAVCRPTLRLRWWIAAAIACGLGVLTKGIVAFVLVGTPILLFVMLDPRTARVRLSHWALFCLLAIGVAAPWLILITMRYPDFLTYFFWKHHVVRYLTPFDHAKPAWYFLGEILLGMLPWSFMLWPLAKTLLRNDATIASRRPSAIGFAMLAAVWSLLFFSLAGSKRAGYILPALPPLAIAMGWYLDFSLRFISLREAHASWSSMSKRLGWRLAMLVLGFGLILVWGVRSAELVAWPTAAAMGALLSSALVLLYFFGGGSARSGWIAVAGTTFGLLFAGTHLVYPEYARRFSLRDQVQPFVSLATESEIHVVSYPRSWDSVSYYLRLPNVRVYTTQERDELLKEIRIGKQTLAIYKIDKELEESLNSAPMALLFRLRQTTANVSVGWFRPFRTEPPSS